MQIWKYELCFDSRVVEVPEGAKFIAAQMQGDTPCAWAIVHDWVKRVDRELIVVGTGHEFNADCYEYIGTFQMHGGALVLHAFVSKES